MDVQQASRSAMKIKNEKENLEDILDRLSLIKTNMNTTWMGKSSDNWKQKYNLLVDNLKAQSEILEAIYLDLTDEIKEWEFMTSKLA